jgi:hypothetical protein
MKMEIRATEVKGERRRGKEGERNKVRQRG